MKCDDYSYCDDLKSRMQRVSVKGLVYNEYVDQKTLKPKINFPSYCKDRHDAGLPLNFCPFCGYDFQPRFKKA